VSAYERALARQRGRALITPAERAAYPRVIALQVLRDCQHAAVAIATYHDGEGGRFRLHVNLVRRRAGWRVFDVAEAGPSIPLPAPLTKGPGAC
jgi:hypothetical protein